MKDYETCEHCYGQSPDVRLRHDPIFQGGPQNEGYHIWVCDACYEERVDKAKSMMAKVMKEDK
jgi:hypothetical protein